MDIGMLWFDNDPKTDFSAKVERAAHYYHDKYGRTPTVCFVNPRMLPGNNLDFSNPSPIASAPEIATQTQDDIKITAAGLVIRPAQSVLPNHFWIGVNGLSAA